MAEGLRKLYDALVEAGATTERASDAAEEVAAFETQCKAFMYNDGADPKDTLCKDLFLKQVQYLIEAKNCILRSVKELNALFL